MYKIEIATTLEAVEKSEPEVKALCLEAKSNLSFHQISFPKLWYQFFNGEDGAYYGDKRGRNFFGQKSVLKSMHYVSLVYSGKLVGFMPLVFFDVFVRGEKEPVKLLSFSGDSVLMFFQDILVLQEHREEGVKALVDHLAQVSKQENALVYLGYIPEDSENLIFLEKSLREKISQGFSGGMAYNRSRPGVYPWNIKPLVKALLSYCEKLPEDSDISARINELIEKLEAQTSALLVFAATRKNFEEELERIITLLESNPDTSDCRKPLEEAIKDHLIVYPYIRLPQKPEDYSNGLSSSKRYYFKRYFKKFFAQEAVFEKLEPSDITEKDVDDYLSLHVQRWGDESIMANDLTLDFQKQLCLALAKDGVFRMFFAKWKGKRIAVHVCIDAANRREYFFSGRDMEAQNLRAGKLMVMHTIEDAITSGFEIYDFGFGGDEYKADFTKEARHVKCLLLCAEASQMKLEQIFPKFEYIKIES